MQYSKSGARLGVIAAVGVLLLQAGCATTGSQAAKPLPSAQAQRLALAQCDNVTVLPFGVPVGGKVDPSVGISFSRDIEMRLQGDYGPIFKSVAHADQARGLDQECLVRGELTKYKPGSKVARAVLIGLGAASLEGNVRVVDAGNQQELLAAPFDKLWAWGGVIGASKGIEEMSHEAAAAVASTVAQGKGWTPPAKR